MDERQTGSRLAMLCAGGTGGHIFPAEALASELIARGWSVRLVTDERADRFSDRFPGPIDIVRSATVAGRNPVGLAKSALQIGSGVFQARALLARHKPDVVVGFGGYPTVPPMIAAKLQRRPTMIHEQNAVMGRANHLLARFVDRIAGGFLSPEASTHPEKTVQIGNPVRPAILERAGETYAAPAEDAPIRLLVFGGSQGAQFFGEAVPDAIGKLPPDLRGRVAITQQARGDDEAAVRERYAQLGVPAEISTFFADMAERIAGAHLLLCRSGASTVTELSVLGRPAILVPYPHALDHDQAANAAALERQGGALVKPQGELTPEALSKLLAELLSDPQRLSQMAEAAKRTGRPDAASLLADQVESIASG